MSIRFEIPVEWANPALYTRFGAVMKEASSGRIVGFVQEVGGGMLDVLPPVDPISLGLKVAKMGVDVVQKQKMIKLLQSVQLISSVGAVASVATLGVSAVGFALVMKKITRMEGKLDQLLDSNRAIRAEVELTRDMVDALSYAKLNSALNEISILSHSTDRERQRDTVSRAVERVAEMKFYYLKLLSSPSFQKLRTADVAALNETHERLLAACYGEIVGEFLLGDSMAVIEERLRRIQGELATIKMQDEGALYRRLAEGDRAAGVDFVTPREERIGVTKVLHSIWNESEDRLASVPHVARMVRDAGLSPERFQEMVEQHGKSTGLPLVGVRVA